MLEFDPNNPTFYGESYALWDAVNVTGTAITDNGWAIQYLYDDDLSQQLSAGDSIVVDVNPRARYLQATDEAVISWVVEVDEGSSGTIAFRAGKDPNWDPNPALATENLGGVTVSGRQTIVLRQTTFTVADIFNTPWPAPILLVEVTAGSVSLKQIRLRVWPPNGPSGQWIPEAGFTRQRGPSRMTVWSRDIEGTSYGISLPGASQTTWADAWSKIVSDVLAAGGQPMVWDPDSGVNGDIWMRLDNDSGGSGQFSWGYMHPVRIFWRKSSVSPGRFPHPDIVPDESAAWGVTADGGTIWTSFLHWTGGIHLWWNSPRLPGQYGVAPSADDFKNAEGSWPPKFQGTYRSPVSYHASDETPPPIPDMTITPVPGEFFTTPPEEWFDYNVGTDLGYVGTGNQGLWAVEQVPDHVIFDPALPWIDDDEPPTPTPRFFWLDEFGQWRAIGPGKPADDPVLLRIKTALGQYREPRQGEDVEGHGAHPLKVKTSEGYGAGAWDTPVWMTPLD